MTEFTEDDYIPGTRSLKGQTGAPGSGVAGSAEQGDLGALDHHAPMDIMISQGKTLAEISKATGLTGAMLLSFIPDGYFPGIQTYLSKEPAWSQQPSGYDGSMYPVAPWASNVPTAANPAPAPSPTPAPAPTPAPVPAPAGETLAAFKLRLINFINA